MARCPGQIQVVQAASPAVRSSFLRFRETGLAQRALRRAQSQQAKGDGILPSPTFFVHPILLAAVARPALSVRPVGPVGQPKKWLAL